MKLEGKTMPEEKKQGLFAKLFGGRGCNCCCNVHIEEVPDSEPEEPDSTGDNDRPSPDGGKPVVGPASRRTGDDNSGDRA